MGGGKLLEAAAPWEDLLERNVGQVVGRAVGVAAVDQRGEVAVVDLLAVGDPVGADDPGEADVDHLRVDHVEADTEDRQDDDADRQPADRHVRDQRPLP